MKKFRINHLVLLLLLLVAPSLLAQVPSGYYDDAEGLSNKALKTALSKISNRGKHVPSYGSGTWSAFEKTDKHPDGYVWDMYSYNKRYFPGNGGAASGMNIEHSVAQSWFNKSSQPRQDLYHLNPSDVSANSRRGNYPLGTTNAKRVGNESIKVGSCTYPGYSGSCFEPDDEYKGDFARAYLYMFTCYEDVNWSSASNTMITWNESWPMLNSWAKSLLVEWSRMDPPSEKELNRAAAIYKIQGNRNPFIDYPELVEHLWGNRVGVPFGVNTTDPMLLAPFANSRVEFPETHFTSSAVATVAIEARNLTESLTFTLQGEYASLFHVEKTSCSASAANEGTALEVSFHPTQSGNFTATLLISSSELASPVPVVLAATAVDNFMALAATQVTPSGFTANWTRHSQATNYIITLEECVVLENQEVVVLDQDITHLPSGWSEDGYVSYDKTTGAKMASGSRGGALITNELNLSAPTVVKVRAKQYGSDNGAPLRISVDGKLVSSQETSKEFETYTFELPAYTRTSKIKFEATSDNRLYLQHISIVTGGDVETLLPVEGYPLTVGAITSHPVTGLKEDASYVYSVQSMHGATSLGDSNQITVKTATIAGDESSLLNQLRVVGGKGTITVQGITTACNLFVYAMNGNQVMASYGVTDRFVASMPQAGIYLVQVVCGQQQTTLKVVVW